MLSSPILYGTADRPFVLAFRSVDSAPVYRFHLLGGTVSATYTSKSGKTSTDGVQ